MLYMSTMADTLCILDLSTEGLQKFTAVVRFLLHHKNFHDIISQWRLIAVSGGPRFVCKVLNPTLWCELSVAELADSAAAFYTGTRLDKAIARCLAQHGNKQHCWVISDRRAEEWAAVQISSLAKVLQGAGVCSLVCLAATEQQQERLQNYWQPLAENGTIQVAILGAQGVELGLADRLLAQDERSLPARLVLPDALCGVSTLECALELPLTPPDAGSAGAWWASCPWSEVELSIQPTVGLHSTPEFDLGLPLVGRLVEVDKQAAAAGEALLRVLGQYHSSRLVALCNVDLLTGQGCGRPLRYAIEGDTRGHGCFSLTRLATEGVDTLLHMGQPLRHPAGHGAAAAMAGLRAALKQGLLQAAPMAGPGTLRALRSGALSSVQATHIATPAKDVPAATVASPDDVVSMDMQ